MGKKKTPTKGKTVGELVAEQRKDLTTQALNPTSWGKMTLTKNDLIIPRLQLVQAMSDLFRQKKAMPGDIIESLNGTKVASEGKPLEVIPIFVFKKYKVSKMVENSKTKQVEKEFLETVAIQDNPTILGYNDDLSYQDTRDIEGKTVPILNERTYDLYFTLPKVGRDIAYVMSFSSSNMKSAKKILLQMALNQEAGKTPAAYCFNLDIITQSNEKSTWYVTEAKIGREATEDEQGQAFKWYKRLQAGEAKAHEESESV